VVPLLIREVLAAPDAPAEAAIMMEAALMHVNSKRPDLSVDMLLAAMASWSKVQPIPAQAAFYFVFSIGLSYESADLQQLAISAYELARQLAETAFGSSSCLVASALSQAGCVWYHQRQITASLRAFLKARSIREAALGYEHADTASLLNNIGACFDCLNRFTEARDCYMAAQDILLQTLDASHPRIRAVSTNMSSSGRHSLDFEVSFEPLRAMQLPKGMVSFLLGARDLLYSHRAQVLLFGKSTAGKKGKKGGGKKKK
jgi:tetratricopeptide (TPR) repeat protein